MSYSVSLTPFPSTFPSKEEAKGAINEAIIDAKKVPSNLSSCFFISCFTVPVTPSVNRPEFFYDFVILILSISSLQMNKVNLIPALTAAAPALFLCIFLPKLQVKSV